jgi:ADP-ribose pyrophosphatase YjhB (NUDIX family)
MEVRMCSLSPIRSYTIDPGFPDAPTTIEKPFLDGAIYLEMIRKTAIACADVVFVVRGAGGRIERKLYLAKRNVFPMKGIWLIGGRIFFNDRTVTKSVQRSAKRETGIEFDSERFIPLATNLYTWGKVAQGDFPGKNLACTFLLVLRKDEVKTISNALIKEEYEAGFGLQGFTHARLVRENCHPMLLDLFDQIFPTREMRAEAIRLAKLPVWKR